MTGDRYSARLSAVEILLARGMPAEMVDAAAQAVADERAAPHVAKQEILQSLAEGRAGDAFGLVVGAFVGAASDPSPMDPVIRVALASYALALADVSDVLTEDQDDDEEAT